MGHVTGIIVVAAEVHHVIDWRWDAVTIQDFDANGEGFNNDLQIQMTFNDWNKCNRHMEGHFIVEIWDETRGFMWDNIK